MSDNERDGGKAVISIKEMFYPAVLLAGVSIVLFSVGHRAMGAFVAGVAVLTVIIAALVTWLLRKG